MSQDAYPRPATPGYVTKSGVETITGSKLFKTADGSTPLRVEGSPSQVSEVLVVANDSGTWFLSVDKDGVTSLTTAGGFQPSTGTLEIVANGTQTAPLTAWINNSGQVAATVDPDGSIHSPTVKAYAGRLYARANFR